MNEMEWIMKKGIGRLDYDELEYMDPDERREMLEDAGLDPDDYDF